VSADDHAEKTKVTPERDLRIASLDEQAEARIRRVLHEGRWFFSVIDVIGLLTEANIPRNYWSDLKRKLSLDEGYTELHARIVQLKMAAADGKRRLTDAADTETLLRTIESIALPHAGPFKQWFARVGAERLEEMTLELALTMLSEATSAGCARGWQDRWRSASADRSRDGAASSKRRERKDTHRTGATAIVASYR
jgi:hypothetical protein